MAAEPTRPRIAVVFGGRSGEHQISCLTARSVLDAIDHSRYEVIPIGIAPDGRWVLAESGPAELPAGQLPSVDGSGDEVVLADSRLRVSGSSEVPHAFGKVDAVFPLLHGPWGEDGTIQGLFEMAGVRYVGAGVLSSAVAMDKAYANIVFSAAGLPQLPHVVVRAREWKEDRAAVRESIASLGMPVFVKPARAGSSMGASLVHDDAALDAAVAAAQQNDPKFIVEAAAVGAREIECGVIESPDGPPEASVTGEIRIDAAAGHEFYDFEAKYLDGSSETVVPADVPEQVSETIRSLAVEAFEALGCEGLARVDFFLLPDGQVLINELNTMPGFTPYSLFPRMWAESGLDYPALVERLIELALRRDTGLR